jgi:hypothetical protein
LRILLCGFAFLATACVAVSYGQSAGKPEEFFINEPKSRGDFTSQRDNVFRGRPMNKTIFRGNMYSAGNLAYSESTPMDYSKFYFFIRDKKKNHWEVNFAAGGLISKKHPAFFRHEKGKKKGQMVMPAWMAGYPHLEFGFKNRTYIKDGREKDMNLRATWDWTMTATPGRGNRWQVMYEIHIRKNGKLTNLVQIEILKQGVGGPEGKPVRVDGRMWYRGKFPSTWAENVMVQRFSLAEGFKFNGKKRVQGMQINFFPFLEYLADRGIDGITKHHYLGGINAGIEIGRGYRGSKFETTYYGIALWKKKPSGSKGTSSEESSEESGKNALQMSAIRQEESAAAM